MSEAADEAAAEVVVDDEVEQRATVTHEHADERELLHPLGPQPRDRPMSGAAVVGGAITVDGRRRSCDHPPRPS